MYECHDEIEILSRKAKDLGEVKAKYDEMKDMRVKIQSNLDKAEKDLKFYWENDECPTCNQVVSDKTALIDGASARKERFLNGLNVITDSLNRGNKQIKELKGYAEKINANNHEAKGTNLREK